jgi:hypothetical protein
MCIGNGNLANVVEGRSFKEEVLFSAVEDYIWEVIAVLLQVAEPA